MIGEHDTLDGEIGGQGRLERITLSVLGHWACYEQSDDAVVARGTQHQRGPPARLLTTGLGIKVNPDHVPAFWSVHSRISLPTGGPQFVAGCALSGVIPAKSSERL